MRRKYTRGTFIASKHCAEEPDKSTPGHSDLIKTHLLVKGNGERLNSAQKDNHKETSEKEQWKFENTRVKKEESKITTNATDKSSKEQKSNKIRKGLLRNACGLEILEFIDFSSDTSTALSLFLLCGLSLMLGFVSNDGFLLYFFFILAALLAGAAVLVCLKLLFGKGYSFLERFFGFVFLILSALILWVVISLLFVI